jgi:hypothetical protein
VPHGRSPPSPPHTGQARFRASGVPTIGLRLCCAVMRADYYPVQRPWQLLVSRSLRPVLALLQRPGWASRHRLLWTRCPCGDLGDLSPSPAGSPRRVRRCAPSPCAVSRRCPSVPLAPGEPGRKARCVDVWSVQRPPRREEQRWRPLPSCGAGATPASRYGAPETGVTPQRSPLGGPLR